MSNPDLAINFNVFDADAERQELQKQQAYINQLNAMIIALQTASSGLQDQVTALKKRLDASPY